MMLHSWSRPILSIRIRFCPRVLVTKAEIFPSMIARTPPGMAEARRIQGMPLLAANRGKSVNFPEFMVEWCG